MSGWRGAWRRLAFGLPTLLGIARRGFFIPYRYAGNLPDAATLPQYEAARTLFARHEADFAALLDDLGRYESDLLAIAADRTPGAARFDQDWFPTLDAVVAYGMVRMRRPGRIVEIGSGHSTRFLARAITDGKLATRLTAIDPQPRAAIRRLAIEHVAVTVPPRDPASVMPLFDTLQDGDMLFVDSSHVLMPGSDVDHVLNRLVPALPAGAILHLHDILLPDPYPADWRWRGYNEQNAVLPLLIGGGFRPLFASHHAATRMAGRVADSVVGRLPGAPGAMPASLWLERAGPPDGA